MKKRWTALLLSAAMLFALTVTAAAAEDRESGFYGIGTAERVEIVPLTADGNVVSGVVRDVDASGVQTLFYADSAALRVTVSATVSGIMYFLSVSSGDAVLYADQQTGAASVSFNVSFPLPEQRADFLLSIGSNEPGFAKISVPLSYTPAAASENTASDDGSCPRDESCPMAAYSDLSLNGWYHDGVHFVLADGLMNGMGNGKFAPNGDTSRGMIVTILYRLEGKPDVSGRANPFEDVADGTWYNDAVIWAAENKIVEGYGDGHFDPTGNITREQLAVILYRYAKSKGESFTGTWMFQMDYPDASDISRWADEAMRWCVTCEIINGKDGKLVPGGNASRAEAATMLMRYLVRSPAE